MATIGLETFFGLLREIPFRGKRRLLGSLAPRFGMVSARVFGAILPLDLANHVDRSIYLGCYEPLNTHRVRTLLRPGMTVVDAGANIGYFSLLAAKRVGTSGRVLAFEPHPKNYAVLANAVRVNGLTQVETLQLALDAVVGEGTVTMPDQARYPNRTASMLLEAGDSAKVRTITLDQVMEERGLACVDLLKVDVEGFETRILKGASRQLARGGIKNILIEFNPYWLRASGSSAEVILGLLPGYRDVSRRHWIAERFLGRSEDRHFVCGSAKGRDT